MESPCCAAVAACSTRGVVIPPSGHPNSTQMLQSSTGRWDWSSPAAARADFVHPVLIPEAVSDFTAALLKERGRTLDSRHSDWRQYHRFLDPDNVVIAVVRSVTLDPQGHLVIEQEPGSSARWTAEQDTSGVLALASAGGIDAAALADATVAARRSGRCGISPGSAGRWCWRRGSCRCSGGRL